jgi:formate dehydrogenase alpha subunit
MGSVDGQIIEVNPSQKKETVNQSTLCVRGHIAHDFLNVSERLSSPLIRRNGEFSSATWEEVFEFVAEQLMFQKKKNGPQSLGFFGSSKCTIEENYLFQKIARVFLETNNVDNGSYLSGRSILRQMNERLNSGGRITPLSDLEQAEAIFVVGANPTQSTPVVSYYLKRASRMNKIPLIIADPRKTGLVPFSTLWLPLAPNSDCELINALAALLYGREAYDKDFIGRFTEGFDHYCGGLSSLDLKSVSQVTGLDKEMMKKAADLLEGKKITFVIGHGILQQRHGTLAADALLNLALMTGSPSEGKGLYFLAKENNQIGAWDMGAVPDFLPGRQSVSDEASRKHWEKAWLIKLSPDPGLNIIRMIEEAGKGNLKALYIMGENPVRSLPQPEYVNNALKNLEFLVVQDILENETSHLADVVLPGAAFGEKGGSFTNLEGRIQSFEPVVSPPGEAKPDWEILNELAVKMGHPSKYKSLERMREEISKMVPMYSELVGNGGESWIKETSHSRPFHFSPVISTVEEIPDGDYPLKAILGSLRYHLGSGTRTNYSDRIKSFDLKGEVEISPEDGARINLKEGDRVRISSFYGSISREVKLERDLSPGLIFIPTAFHNNDAQQLIGLTRLGEADSPGWKSCDVKIERID